MSQEKIKPSNNHINVAAESWWRTQSATMALLKHAQRQIDDAEERINEQNSRITALENLAMTDELTGLLNRRGLQMEFARDMSRIQRNKGHGGIFVLIDLDKFKKINDTYGHLAGDACLKLIGELLQDSIRGLDIASRLGGDEFAVILTDTAPRKALRKALWIKEKLNSLELNWKGTIIPLGASMGVEAYYEVQSFEDIYNAADTALYADKQIRRKSGLQREI